MGLKNNELDLDKLEQIADILWLSKYIDKVEVIEVDNNIIDDFNNSSNDSSSQDETDIEEEEEREEEITSDDEQTTKSSSDASLYTNDKKNNQPTNIKADPIKAPKKLSMSSYRDWEKCFKLLRHKVDSKKEFLLDEEETVETIARTHLYQPIFRAKKINYFDLIMIIDKNDSMEIWFELVNEFQKTIQRFGVFRQIYFYYMLSNQEDVKLFADKNMQREVSYKKLNLNARTLVTVVSDCVSTGWHNNQIFSMIELWSERSSTSIVQMFPKRMWQGTSLYKGLQTSFSSIKFNPLNKHLKSDEDEFYDDDKTLNIPVINFDPRSFESWGSVILGKRKKWIDGILLEDIEILEKLDLISEEQEITAEERVDRYFSQASPLAQKLAIYASLLPINFHVIRILQELQLPDSTQIHLAEFFLGGLIKRDISEIDGKKVVSYSFYSNQVQEMLRGMLANPTAYSIQKKMSSFVANHINSSLDFQALMDNPESISGLYLNEEDIAFVKLRAETLRGLGGQYAKRAEILIEGIIDKEEEDEFDNSNFNIYDYSSSLILIESKESNNKSFGTGFVIHQDQKGSYVLTCAHIVENAVNIKIENYSVEIIGINSGFDLALLYVKDLFEKPLNLQNENFSDKNVELIGYKVFSSGAHQINRVEATLLENKMSIFNGNHSYDSWEIVTSGDVSRLENGQAGSPLISKETGRVIGVVRIRYANGKKGYAIPIEYLKDVWTDKVPLFIQKLNTLELLSQNSFFKQDTMENSIILITSKDNNKSFGTGFILYLDNHGSYVITCAHVVESVGTPMIENYKVSIKAFGSGDDVDLAILYVEGLFGKPFSCQNKDLSSQDIELMGYAPFHNNYQKRIVSGKLETEKVEIVTGSKKYNSWIIETNDMLYSGITGAPLISIENGNVVGILTNISKNKGYVTSIEHIKNIWIDKDIPFLEKLNPFKLTSSNSYITKHQLDKSVVLIQSKVNNDFETGFVIHQDSNGSYILTGSHIVERSKELFIDELKVEIIALDENNDIGLAVVYVAKIFGKSFKLSTTEKCLNNNIEFRAYSSFTQNKFRIQTQEALLIDKTKKIKDIEYYEIKLEANATLENGMTGSPIFCPESGDVIAVLSLKKGSKEGYAIPTSNLSHIWKDMSEYFLAKELDYYEIGNKYIEDKEYNKAIEAFEKMLQKNPKRYDEYLNVCQNQVTKYFNDSQVITGDSFEEVMLFYYKAIEINPKSYEAYIQMGDAYFKEYFKKDKIKIISNPNIMNSFDKAIDMYKKAIEINPNNEKAYIRLGDIYLEGSFSLDISVGSVKNPYSLNAIEVYTEALRINPNNKEISSKIEELKFDIRDKEVKIENMTHVTKNKNYTNSIVLITNTENNNFGTGFVIYREENYSYILTSSYTIEKISQSLLVHEVEAKIIYQGSSDGLDLAVLKVKIDKEPLSLIESDCDKFEIIGFKSFRNNDYILEPIYCTLDTKIEFRPQSGEKVIGLKLNINDSDIIVGGYSGSPIICKENGKVVGVITGKQGNSKVDAISIENLKTIWKNMPKNLIKKENYIPKIFISSSLSEMTIAKDFSNKLKNLGYEIFLDLDDIGIQFGKNFIEKIYDELSNCDYFLLLLSENSLRSERVLTEIKKIKELQQGSNLPVILPVRINLSFDYNINYDILKYIDKIQSLVWENEHDTKKIIDSINETILNNKNIDISKPLKDNSILEQSFTIEFTTSIFDVSKEEPHFNETAYGQSVLLWLKKQLQNTIKMEDIDMEDWGWYSYIECENEKYKVGASTHFYKKNNDNLRWSFFMQKEEKSFFQKMKEKLATSTVSDNNCLIEVKDIFMREKSFEDIELVESE